MRRRLMASLVGVNDERGRRGRGRAAGLAAGLALLLCLVGAASASAAPWGYEQVSPFEKGSGPVSAIDTFTAAPDGESILYSAFGSFAEVPSLSVPVYTRYFAERGSERWLSQATDPPRALPAEGVSGATYGIQETMRSSANLRYSIEASLAALTPGAIQGGSNLYMRDNRTGELKLMLADPDYRLVQLALGNLGEEAFQWVAPDGKAALFIAPYEVEGLPSGQMQWTEQGGVEYVGYYPPEGGVQKTGLATASTSQTGTREPLPADDAVSKLYLAYGAHGSPQAPAYLRENGNVKPISVSEVTGDEGRVAKAEVNAVTNGGRYAFITTTQGPLTDTTPAGKARVLYRYDSVAEDLEYVGHASTSTTSMWVMQASPDGSTVVFTSSEALTPGSTVAPSSATNLYFWRNGHLHLVFQADPNSNVGKYLTSRTLMTISHNGRYLYFTDNSASLASKYGTTTTSLACAEPKAPTVAKPCDQVYVYDADANAGLGTLECASCVEGIANGSSGDPSSGNSGYMRFNVHPARSVSNDGRAFFTTIESFDPNDKNGLEDVYEFHAGEHRLVSTAREGQRSRFVDASEDGKTIFFTTTDPIVPQDKDKVLDLYMTREGAGFPYTPPAETPPCLAVETCHGAVSAGNAGPNPATSSFHGQPNPPIAVGRVTVTKAAANAKRVRVTVRVSGPGKVTASGPGLKSASTRATKAGKVTLTLPLAPKSEQALNKHGRLNRKVTVSFQPFEGRGATATKALTLKASGQKAAKHRAAKHGGGR